MISSSGELEAEPVMPNKRLYGIALLRYTLTRTIPGLMHVAQKATTLSFRVNPLVG